MRMRKRWVARVDANGLQATLAKGVTIVMFSADWSGPDRQFDPVIDEIARRRQRGLTVVELDTDANADLAKQYGVDALPTLAFMVDGRMTDKLIGVRPEAEVDRWIEQQLGVNMLAITQSRLAALPSSQVRSALRRGASATEIEALIRGFLPFESTPVLADRVKQKLMPGDTVMIRTLEDKARIFTDLAFTIARGDPDWRGDGRLAIVHAATLCEALIPLLPNYAPLWTCRATAMFELGNLDVALAASERAIFLANRNEDYSPAQDYLRTAEILVRRGDFANARTALGVVRKHAEQLTHGTFADRIRAVEAAVSISTTGDSGTTGAVKITTSAKPEPGPATQQNNDSLQTLLAELDSLIGLPAVKREVRRLVAFLTNQQRRRRENLKVPATSLHLVFVGNPGTGKTTVARIISKIYRALGLLSTGELVEADRGDLVAGYIGQTAIKTSEVLKRAHGGVLFIDEAYALDRGDEKDFGNEAIGILLKDMEDQRDTLAVIVAGYPVEMARFLEANPGLKSRFDRTIVFDDYSADELVAVFDLLARQNEFEIAQDARPLLRARIERAVERRDRTFGNARYARNVFESTIRAQGERLAEITEPTREQLVRLEARDFAET